jgi:hypothetical protein
MRSIGPTPVCDTINEKSEPGMRKGEQRGSVSGRHSASMSRPTVRRRQNLRLLTPSPDYFFLSFPVFSELNQKFCTSSWHPDCFAKGGIGCWV